MKNPLIHFPLLLINGLWLGLVVGLVMSPLIGCLFNSRIVEIYAFTPILMLILIGLYKSQIKQFNLLIFNVIAVICTLYGTKTISAHHFGFLGNYCSTLRVYEGNDMGALFVLSVIYLGFLVVEYAMKWVVLNIKNNKRKTHV